MSLHHVVPLRKQAILGSAPETVHFCPPDWIGPPIEWDTIPRGWRDVLECLPTNMLAHRTDDNRLLLMLVFTDAQWWGHA